MAANGSYNLEPNGNSKITLNDGEVNSNSREVIGRSTTVFSPGWRGVKERIWRKKVLHKRVPCTQWLATYSRDDGIGDLIAGLSIGLMIIPQMLAFAGLAGLDSYYGLYSSFLGCFTYVLIGSSSSVVFSPTATSSLMVFIAAGGVWQRAILLTFITGLVQLTAAILRLGFIIDFVSGPVGAGFTSAMAFTIIASQLKSIFGITSSGTTFIAIISSLSRNLGDTKLGDVVLGLCCMAFLLFFRVS